LVKTLALAALLSACLHAQMPEVTGKVVDAAVYRYIDIQEGGGAEAKPGQEYTVHYTGWLRDGKQFDSSVGKDPLKFVQGRRAVIAGFDVGFEGMKVGAKRRLFIPYQFAYGEKGRGSIPPRAELIFDVELVGVRDVPPAPPAAADLLIAFKELEEHALALAKAVPEEKYGWRPAAGVRSFKEVFLHIVNSNQLLLDIADGKKTGQPPSETADLTKDLVLERLTASFATVRQTLESASAASLSRDVRFRGADATRRGVFVYLDAHIGEHLGQAIAYARMNGIVPPWSK
jgi:uncharacterized damage-inducible protein DinB